ncbi:DUF3955 domain-containing protein [Senegalia massiliensis]|uniref:DUF3955 domain-containing protein n=1 Tax=Senegalia massiliensis TaxID=1720316 RepID=A0A845R0C0_9CLOT|nr:DUF3955 domain-containing protein [Senegalia massiliensis]NBI07664.1 DUF3955 domain-containing protein [Senegalia massiliensis]
MKKYLFSIILGIMSFICLMGYNIIGSTVLSDGTLSEPFFLIPIGLLLAAISIISAILIYIVPKFIKINN